MSCIFFDTETNGIGLFRPPTQRLMQLAWIYNYKKYNYIISDVNQVSDKVPHDLTPEICNNYGVPFEIAFGKFIMHLRKADKLVAHNIDFDIGIIRNELLERNLDYTEFVILSDLKSYCTMKSTIKICQIKRKNGIGIKQPTLEELYIYCFGVSPSLVLHDALNDCVVLQKCYKHLNKKPRKTEIERLKS
jgi:DNA polymerase III epsilon subunit-like protein